MGVNCYAVVSAVNGGVEGDPTFVLLLSSTSKTSNLSSVVVRVDPLVRRTTVKK